MRQLVILAGWFLASVPSQVVAAEIYSAEILNTVMPATSPGVYTLTFTDLPEPQPGATGTLDIWFHRHPYYDAGGFIEMGVDLIDGPIYLISQFGAFPTKVPYNISTEKLTAYTADETLIVKFRDISLYDWVLDRVAISYAVPEPSTAVLAGFGAAGLLAFAVRRRLAL